MSVESSAIYLSENLFELNSGATFLSALDAEDQAAVKAVATRISLKKGQTVFHQGDTHCGIWIIEYGRIRTYYSGPSGKEITLAYWSEGHFVGGPEVFGGGKHVWSANTMEDSGLLFLSGEDVRALVSKHSTIAVALIEGLESKGKAYSALIQMLGTRSVSERLQQLLLILVDNHSKEGSTGVVIARTMTNEQIATIVGATRQWVTQSFDNLQKKGVLSISRKEIVVHHPESLSE